MRAPLRSQFTTILISLSGFVTLTSVSAVDERKEGGPKRVLLTRGDLPTPLAIRGARDISGSLQGVATSNGIASGVGVYIAGDTDGDPNLPKAKTHEYYVRYPSLRADDIVPMFSAVYRVQDVWRAGGDSGISFLRLPDKEHKLEIPTGIGVSPGTYVFPMGFGAVGKLHGYQVRVYSMRDENGNTDPPKVKIVTDLRHRDDERELPNDHTKIEFVKVGELLTLGDDSHRVTKIVPPNPKLQVIGWIEISQSSEKTPPKE